LWTPRGSNQWPHPCVGRGISAERASQSPLSIFVRRLCFKVFYDRLPSSRLPFGREQFRYLPPALVASPRDPADDRERAACASPAA